MADARAADRESRRLIREELSTNFLVEAGAGSGKTQMLAERMAAGVAAGVYQVEHMAAVTFTRKAASELRGRFQLALEEILRRPDLPSGRAGAEQRARVNAALGNLERVFAGTIHSFCARLLRERPVESGVSPGFVELDELQDLELRRRAWRDFITSARAAGDADMLALLDADVKPQDLDQAFGVICTNEDVEFPPGDGTSPDPKPVWKRIDRFWKSIEKLVPMEIDPNTSCPIQKAAREFRGHLRVARYRQDRPSFVASVLRTWDCESRITQNRWSKDPAEKQRLRDFIQPLHAAFVKDTVTPYLTSWRQYVYKLAVSLLTRARDNAARERQRHNSLNYGDLLNVAVRVLRTDPRVRAALQRKYRLLFVDEFQDTDPIQAEIIFLLAAQESTSGNPPSTSGGAESVPDVDWRTVPLRPGALFVVGDPKQSIYRFRRADIDIYTVVRERFSDPAIGRVLSLTMNFRSGEGLCTWANEVFKTRFPATADKYRPQFATLEPRDDAGRGEVFTLTLACDKVQVVVEEDARKIAACIRSEVDAGRRGFSDFLILTKRRKYLDAYARALEARNVPLEVSGAGAFGASAEVRVLSGLLRVLADPIDALSLVAVLRGPLFGISDPDLFAFRQAGGWFSLFFEPPDASFGDAVGPTFRSGVQRVTRALGALRQYHRWTRLMPAGSALDRILEDTGYLALAATTPGGVEAGDLVHAVDRVRQVVEDGGSLADASAALDDDREESTEVESLPLEPGRTDVVRVMNLHKAKGLEAKVVFLAEPYGGWSLRPEVHIERRGRTAQGWFKLVHKRDNAFSGDLLGQHADWPEHEQAELPYLEAEEDRLLYVAATRAREALIVSRVADSKKNTAWGVLDGFLEDVRELKIPAPGAIGPVKPLDCSPKAQAQANTDRVVAHDHVREPSWSIASATAEARHIAQMTRSVVTSDDDPTRVVSPTTRAHRADAGMAWGALIHGLLEHAMRHPNATREDLRRLGMWLTVEQPQLRSVLDEALDTVQRVAVSEFWTAAAASEHSVETPFTFDAADRELISGVTDLLFAAGQGWNVVDYKTDIEPDSARLAQYAAQTARYQQALTACGLKDVTVALESVRRGRNDRT